MKSISASLLRRVLSAYLLMTVAIFLGEAYLQFGYLRSVTLNDLNGLQVVVRDSVVQPMWDLDEPQLERVLEGIIKGQDVSRVRVLSPQGALLREAADESKRGVLNGLLIQNTLISRAELSQKASGSSAEPLGWLEIHSHDGLVWQRLVPELTRSLVAMIIKALVLALLIKLYFDRVLSQPLFKVAAYARAMDHKRNDYLPVKPGEPDELDVISAAINDLSAQVRRTVSVLGQSNQVLTESADVRLEQLKELNVALTAERANLEAEAVSRQKRETELLELNGRLNELLSEQEALRGELQGQTERMALARAAEVVIELSYRKVFGISSQLRSIVDAGVPDRAQRQAIGDTLVLSSEVQRSLHRHVLCLRRLPVNVGMRFELRGLLRQVVAEQREAMSAAGVRVEIDCASSLWLHGYAEVWSLVVGDLLRFLAAAKEQALAAGAQAQAAGDAAHPRLVWLRARSRLGEVELSLSAAEGGGLPRGCETFGAQCGTQAGPCTDPAGHCFPAVNQLVSLQLKGKLTVSGEDGEGLTIAIVAPLNLLQTTSSPAVASAIRPATQPVAGAAGGTVSVSLPEPVKLSEG